MNRARILLNLLWMLGVFLGPRVSQAQALAVQFPTGDASWTVEVISRAPRPPVPPQVGLPPGQQNIQCELKKMDVTQTKDLTRTELIWSDGKKTEVWWLTSTPLMLTERTDGSGVESDSLTFLSSHLRPDARMFSWVTSQTYVAKSSYKGKACLLYEKKMEPDNRAPSFITKMEPELALRRAWIDGNTLLPVALDNGEVVYLFTFQPAPEGPLTLPERFQKELKRMQDSTPNPKYLGKPRSWGNP